VRDAYDRQLTGRLGLTAATGDFASRVAHAVGVITASRSGAPTFPLRSLNVRSVRVIGYRVPDSARVAFMSTAAGANDPSQFLRGLAAETTLVELPDRLNVEYDDRRSAPADRARARSPNGLVQALVAERLPDAYTNKDYETKRLIALTRSESRNAVAAGHTH
jgi:hypothetical protein